MNLFIELHWLMRLWVLTSSFSNLAVVCYRKYIRCAIHNFIITFFNPQYFHLGDFLFELFWIKFEFHFYNLSLWSRIPIINIQLQFHFIDLFSGLSSTSNWENCGRGRSMRNMFYSNCWCRINFFTLFTFVLWIMYFKLAWFLFGSGKTSNLPALQNEFSFCDCGNGKLIF